MLAGDQNSTAYTNVQASIAKIESFVNAGGIYIANYAAASSSLPYTFDLLPGTPGVGFFTSLSGSDINILDPASRLLTGPGGTLTNTTMDGGNSSFHGYTTANLLPAGAHTLLSTGVSTQIVALDYPLGQGHVLVQGTPVEYYNAGPHEIGAVFHPNWFNYGASFLAAEPEDDYYSITLAAGESVQLDTSTPGDQPNQLVNNLDPALDVFDSAGVKVASDDNGSADHRNASLSFTASVAGTYKVRVSGVAGSSGEYVLTINSSVPPAIKGPSFGIKNGTPLASTSGATPRPPNQSAYGMATSRKERLLDSLFNETLIATA